jgi:hypothetical protein
MGEVDDAKHVEAVLLQDKAIGETLNSRMHDMKVITDEDIDHVAGYYDDLVQQQKAINTGECPREFAEAYSRYITAFTELAGVLHAHPRTPSEAEGFAIGLEAGLESGDPTKGVRAIQGAQDAWKQRWRDKATLAAQAEQEMKAVAERYEHYAWPYR